MLEQIPDKKYIEKVVTSFFTEFKPLVEAHRTAKKQVRKGSKRIETFEKKYQFLIDLVSIGADDNFLADKVKLLLKAAGFTKVVHYRDKRQKVKREDIQAYHENDLFVIEVKGINFHTPKHTDLIQVASYLVENKKRQADKNVYGLSIVSHQKNTPIQYRAKRFDNEQSERDLVNFSIGALPMIGLLLFFGRLKSGKIDFEGFKNTLKETGYIKY